MCGGGGGGGGAPGYTGRNMGLNLDASAKFDRYHSTTFTYSVNENMPMQYQYTA